MVRFLKRGNSLDRFLKLRHMFDHSARRSHSQPYESRNDAMIDGNMLASQQLEVQQMTTLLEINDKPEQTKEEMLLGKAREMYLFTFF
jgi:hypothetical protein